MTDMTDHAGRWSVPPGWSVLPIQRARARALCVTWSGFLEVESYAKLQVSWIADGARDRTVACAAQGCVGTPVLRRVGHVVGFGAQLNAEVLDDVPGPADAQIHVGRGAGPHGAYKARHVADGVGLRHFRIEGVEPVVRTLVSDVR